VPSLLLQKPTAEAFQVTTEMRFEPALPVQGPDQAPNQGPNQGTSPRAGLVVLGTDYAWLGIEHTAAGRTVVLKSALGAREGGEERILASLPAPMGPVQLRATWQPGGLVRFSVSFDGVGFTHFEPIFEAKAGRWVGAKIGLFAAEAAGSSTGAAADFAWFRVTPVQKP
jgi:hypothetical protein